ncbi:MAG: undecaprenyl-diphosphatase UppP [Armatimonadetes bacterium]|nr:undecaprenyl-diphosphatase UppP [Armatimonadota bacterium]
MPSYGVVHINYLQAVLLGLLQGLTEFLPISSTAHMAVIPQILFRMRDPGAAFSAVVQLGPIVAIFAYFWQDVKNYLRGILETKTPMRGLKGGSLDAKLGWFTILGTIPLIIFGVALEHKIDTSFRSLNYIGASLVLLGLILWWAEKVGKRILPLEKITFKQSQVIGWAQVLCLVPGASRSGVTITAGLFEGMDRESAAKFSFLLSIPAITAAGVYKLQEVLRKSHLGPMVWPYLLGSLVAGIFAYIVVRWFMSYMKEHNTGIFIAYRIVLGALVLVLLHSGYVKERGPKVDNPTPVTYKISYPARSLHSQNPPIRRMSGRAGVALRSEGVVPRS